MSIHHDHRFIFVHIPRTGGTTISSFFGFTNPTHQAFAGLPKCATLQEYIKVHPKFAYYFKFAFVRNPWDKVVSEYKWAKSDLNRNKSGIDPYMLVNNGINNFKDFVKKDGTILCGLNHQMPQYKFLEAQRVKVDFIGRYENFRSDFESVLQQFKIKKPTKLFKILACENPNEQKKFTHYSQWYDQETRDIIGERYRVDIRKFKYSFEDRT